MTHTPRAPRAVAQRQALGRRIRAHRLALGLTSRDVAAHIGTSHAVMTSIETTSQDVCVGTLIDAADAVGLNVALAADHHLPLLDLSAAEVAALVTAAVLDSGTCPNPELLSALDKLTTSAEETP